VRVSDFHFDLPAELIAQHTPAERGASRMLVLDRAKASAGDSHPSEERPLAGDPDREQGTVTPASKDRSPGTPTGNREPVQAAIQDAMFRDLPEYLRAGDLLLLNDSRVLPARLFATRAGMGTQANSPRRAGLIEVLLTEEIEDRAKENAGENAGILPLRYPQGQNDRPLVWRALVKPAKKVRVGETLLFLEAGEAGQPALVAEVVEAGEFGERTLRFEAVEDFYGTLDRIGHMPLPPYILREQRAQQDTAEDRERYQTVYSRHPGSAAAPTAGLHFTSQVLEALAARGVEIQSLTLHVGLGTFQPVRVERLEDIRLHAERYTLPEATASALNRALTEGRRIIAVGTTTARALEHIAESGPSGQGPIRPHSGSTAIFIAPGHRFRIVSGLLTNFHLPESTLLMLVSAFAAPPASPAAGRQAILEAYAHAVRERYRFYSYGDCMLLL
jgi:S-adenosylmethionine:tRNA ribosyltransferase-isomerase